MPLFAKGGVARQPDPPPLETNDVLVVASGAAGWLVALVALSVARLAGRHVPTWWIAMCACGTVLGVLGVGYCRRRQQAIARDRAADLSQRDDTPTY